MGHHIEKIENFLMPLIKKTTLITEHQLEQEVAFERAFRFALIADTSADEHFKHATQTFTVLNSNINEELKDSHHILQQALNNLTDKDTQVRIAQLLKNNIWIEEHHANWVIEVNKAFSLLALGRIPQANALAEHIETEAVALEKQVTTMLNKIETYSEHTLHELKNEEESILMTAIVILIVSFLVAIALTHYVIQNLTKNISQLRAAITRISGGDLITKVTSRLGKEFDINIMRQNLHKTLCIVDSSTHEMLGASTELAKISADVKQTIDQQAREIEKISSAMVQMKATSVEVARHAESTQASTRSVTEKVLKSKETTNNAMSLISALNQSLDSSSDNIQKLADQSSQISSVLSVIKGIADQTNLLALNAAIEAARAGEQGRGFAVVADEVRNLAKRTQDSTVEIEEMIEQFTRGTKDAVLSMSQSTAQGNSSKSATLETNIKMNEIQIAINEINDMNNQIATAAEQQSCTSQELSRNTVSISKLSNDNLTSVSQISTASEELAQISMQLKEQLTHFKLS